MIEYSIASDTDALRQCSAFKMRSVIVIGITGTVLSVATFCIGFFSTPTPTSAPPWVAYCLAVVFGSITALFVYLSGWRAKRLIDDGEIVVANVVSITRIRRGYYRIGLAYSHGGRDFKRAIYVDSLTCDAIEGSGGDCRIVILPSKPKTLMPLHEFGRRRDHLQMARGDIGLAESLASAKKPPLD